jgi:hypothetical protein
MRPFELKESVELLDEQCERIVSAIRQIPGANADREEPEALRALYPTAVRDDRQPQFFDSVKIFLLRFR